MKIRILGSAAGGGFPQWNCNCRNCRSVRAGAEGFSARTQSSVAVSADGRSWLLLNASPDLRQQMASTPALWPDAKGGARGSPIAAVALTNADVDHVAGLLNLREGQAFDLYASGRALDAVQSNGIFDVLAPGVVARRELALEVETEIRGTGLRLEAFAVPGKVALYLETGSAADFATGEGDTLGLRVVESATGKAFFYVPGCARLDERLRRRLTGAELVLFDGTLWSEDEMIAQGLMPKTGSRMGHVNMSGTDGSIAAFGSLGVRRKVYIHINNSNPVLDSHSRERAEANAAGWLIGEDGMGFDL